MLFQMRLSLTCHQQPHSRTAPIIYMLDIVMRRYFFQMRYTPRNTIEGRYFFG